MSARFTGAGEQWAQAGQAFVIGAVVLGSPDLLAEFSQPAPDTLAACKAWAVDWVGRFMDFHFGTRDALGLERQTGVLPCLAFPLRVLTLTINSFDLEDL